MASETEIEAAADAIWQLRKMSDPASLESWELARAALEAAERIRAQEWAAKVQEGVDQIEVAAKLMFKGQLDA